MPRLKVSSVQESPPSVLFQRPLRPAPASMPHGVRWNFHIDAYTMRGLVTSIDRSAAPVLSFRNSTFFHLAPPSVVRNTPRSGDGPKACPSDVTNAISGLVGCTRNDVICCALDRPRGVHVCPPSVERYTPVPYVRSSRGLPSPVPTQMTLGSLGATVIAPTDERSVLPSVRFSHD